MTDITLYHNPQCSTSRQALAMIRDSGFEPTVIEYLKTPPDRHTLRSLVQRMGGTVRDLLRAKAPPYSELGLADPKWTDEQLLDFIAQHPVLIERRWWPVHGACACADHWRNCGMFCHHRGDKIKP